MAKGTSTSKKDCRYRKLSSPTILLGLLSVNQQLCGWCAQSYQFSAMLLGRAWVEELVVDLDLVVTKHMTDDW